MRVGLDIEGMSAAFDPASGGWTLGLAGQDYRLRPWRWGERHRMVAAATRVGAFDREAFLEGLVGAVFDPEPPEDLRPLFAYAALELMGVEEGTAPPMPLAEAERRLALQYGWTPGALEEEPAEALDRLVADLGDLPSAAGAPSGDGWTSIRFDGEGGA